MRLIDAESLERRIKDTYCSDCKSYGGVRCRACGTGDALDLLDSEEEVTIEQVVAEHNKNELEKLKEQRYYE